MLNVLAGALVGGLFNVAAYTAVQLIRHKPISWKEEAGSFLGGAVAGAVAGASFGTSLMAGGLIKATGFLAADGALGSVVETGTNNLLEGNPVSQGMAHDAVIGAVEAPIFFGLTKGLGKLIPELDPILVGTDDATKPVRHFAKNAARAAHGALRRGVHYVRSAPLHHHSAFAVAMANQFQGWGGQILQGIWGYIIQVPDFWGSGGPPDPAGSSPTADTSHPSPSEGITGGLAHAGHAGHAGR